jgi:heavy metal translocating P-type ATPase
LKRSIKRIASFIKKYRLFSFTILAIIVASVLYFTQQTKAAGHIVLYTAALVAVLPVLWSMIEDVRNGTYGIDILAATAIVASVILHQPWAAIVVVFMLTGGESLEDYAEHRAHSELDSLLARAPQKAHLLQGRKIVDVGADEVRVGDKIIIRPGEVVPVDAKILEGNGNFDEASLTGESLPQPKGLNEQILSGSINTDGLVTVQALHNAAGSQYQQIIQLVRSAGANQAPFVRLADRYSIPFTVTAYALGAAAWILSGQPIRFLEVIIVATPCPLLLAAPIALISGMSRASKYGIIVKTGSALEKLAEAESIAFDKTGTLTSGIVAVSSVQAFSPFKQAEILSYAASLEQHSNHILATAIVSAATTKHVAIQRTKHVSEIAGLGMNAHTGGKDIHVGRLQYMKTNDVTLPRQFKVNSVTETATYVAVNGKLAGIITFSDELRPETKTTLQQLTRLGFTEIIMITGDNAVIAKKIAKQLHIDHVTAEALPGDKLLTLEKVKNRPVVFVGDGVNDSPVLTAADVGIALGARGSTAASESADLVIMQDDLSYVAKAVQVAQQTFRIARQSILIGIGISLVLMGIFATGKFPPVVGAIVQEVVDVIVIFNALRAHSGTFIVGGSKKA